MKDEEKTDQVRTFGPKEKHDDKLPEFHCASYIPDLELRKMANENSNEHRLPKKPLQKLSLLGKESGKVCTSNIHKV